MCDPAATASDGRCEGAPRIRLTGSDERLAVSLLVEAKLQLLQGAERLALGRATSTSSRAGGCRRRLSASANEGVRRRAKAASGFDVGRGEQDVLKGKWPGSTAGGDATGG